MTIETRYYSPRTRKEVIKQLPLHKPEVLSVKHLTGGRVVRTYIEATSQEELVVRDVEYPGGISHARRVLKGADINKAKLVYSESLHQPKGKRIIYRPTVRTFKK